MHPIYIPCMSCRITKVLGGAQGTEATFAMDTSKFGLASCICVVCHLHCGILYVFLSLFCL